MTDLARRTIIGFLKLAVMMTLLVMLPAGSADFWPGWLFLAASLGSTVAITLWLARADPALLERRLEAGPAAERQPVQRLIQVIAAAIGIALMVVPGLDFRFGWSAMPATLVVVGNLGVVAGYWLCFLVFRENTWTFGTVQVAVGQTVVSTGPYAVVRHPMYASALFLFLFGPLALASWWAFVPAAAMIPAVMARILAEERFLEANLPGYTGYEAAVRWRLVPGVW